MADQVIRLIVGDDLDNPLHDEIADAAHEAGWDLKQISTIESEKIASGDLEDVLSNNILWRRQLKNSNQENSLVWEWLDKNKKITMNTHVKGGIEYKAVDKFYQQQQYLANWKIKESAVPSFVKESPEEIVELVNSGNLEYPFILKPRYGSLGKGIITIHNEDDLFEKTKSIELKKMVIEPYIESEFDWRVFVIGNKAIGAMRKAGRSDNPFDFEAKSAGIKKWNETRPDLKAMLSRIAEEAARSLNIEYAAVDLIRSNKTGQIYVVETNLSGGWMNGFSSITGASVPKAMVDWFIEQNKRLVKNQKV